MRRCLAVLVHVRSILAFSNVDALDYFLLRLEVRRVLVFSSGFILVQWSRTLAGVQRIMLAMPHRGPLNSLTGLLQMSPALLFHKIKGGHEFPEELKVVGDVISHLGMIISTIFHW